MTLRRLFWRELEAILNGTPTKKWRKRTVDMLPTQPGLDAK